MHRTQIDYNIAILSLTNLTEALSSVDVGRAAERAVDDELSVVDALENALDRKRRVLRNALQSQHCIL